MIIINADMDNPVSVKHIAWLVNDSISASGDLPEYLTLRELEEVTYIHPDAPRDATITNLEIREIGQYKRSSVMGVALTLFAFAQRNVTNAKSK